MSQPPKMYYMPTRIVHGLGSAAALPAQVKTAGGSKAFICTDKGLTAAGITASVTAHLDAAEVPYAVFDDVEEDPGVRTVTAGVEAFAANGCDLVAALGDVSPTWAGERVAPAAANGGPVAA
jgi:alcohol dehydrogenase class IV